MVGRAYTMLEMYDIVYYILEKKAFSEVKGRRMWDDFSRSGRTNRTWQSLKETFLKRILPDIHNPYYKLKPDEVASFRTGCDVTLNKNNNKLEIKEVEDSRSRGNNKSSPKKRTGKGKGNMDSELSEESSTDTFVHSKSLLRKSGSLEIINLSDNEMSENRDNKKSRTLHDKNRPSTSKRSEKDKKKVNSDTNVTHKKSVRSESVHSSASNASSTDTLVLGKSLMRKSSSIEMLHLSDNETADVTNQKDNNPKDGDSEVCDVSPKSQKPKCIRDRFMYSDPLTPMMQSIIDDFETDSSLEMSESEPPAKKSRKNNSKNLRIEVSISHTDTSHVTSTSSTSKSETTIPNNQEALGKTPCNSEIPLNQNSEPAKKEPEKRVKRKNSQLVSNPNLNEIESVNQPQNTLNIAPETGTKPLENLTAIADKSLHNITEKNNPEKSHKPSNNCTNSTDSFLPANPEALPPESETTDINDKNGSTTKDKKKLHSLSQPNEKTHVTLRKQITLSAPDPSRPFRCASSSDRETSKSPERNKQNHSIQKRIRKDSAHLNSIDGTNENNTNFSEQVNMASSSNVLVASEVKEKIIEPDSESNCEILNETVSGDVSAVDLHTRETIDGNESNRPESPILSVNKADSDETFCEGSIVKAKAQHQNSECTIVNKPGDPKNPLAETNLPHVVDEKQIENRTINRKSSSVSIENEIQSGSSIHQNTHSSTTKYTEEYNSSTSNNTSLQVNPSSVELTETNPPLESVSLSPAASKRHTLSENSDHENTDSLHIEKTEQLIVKTKETEPQESQNSVVMDTKSNLKNKLNNKEHSNKQVNDSEKTDDAQELNDDDETQRTDDSKQPLLRHNAQRDSTNSENSEPTKNKLKTLVLDRMFGFSSGVRSDHKRDEHTSINRNTKERPRHSGRKRRLTGSSDYSSGSESPLHGDHQDSVRLPEPSITTRYVCAPKAVPLRRLLDDGTLVAVCEDGVYPLVRQRGDEIYYLHYMDEELDHLGRKTPRQPSRRSDDRLNTSREFLSDHEGRTNDATYWRNMFYKQKEKVDGLAKLLSVDMSQLKGRDRAPAINRCEPKGPVQEPSIETNVATTSNAHGNLVSEDDMSVVTSVNPAMSANTGTSVNPAAAVNPATALNPATSVNPATCVNTGTSVNPATSINPATSANPALTVPKHSFRINLAKGEKSVTIDGHGDDLKQILGQIMHDYLDTATPAPAKRPKAAAARAKSAAVESKPVDAVDRRPSTVTIEADSDTEVREKVDKMEAEIFAKISNDAAAEGSATERSTTDGGPNVRSQKGKPPKKKISESSEGQKTATDENKAKETMETKESTSLENDAEEKDGEENLETRSRTESGSDKEIIIKRDLEQTSDAEGLPTSKSKARTKALTDNTSAASDVTSPRRTGRPRKQYLESSQTDGPRAKRRPRNQPDSDAFVSPKKTRLSANSSGRPRRNEAANNTKKSPMPKARNATKKSSKNCHYLSVPPSSRVASSSFESSQRSDDSDIDSRLLQMRKHKRMSLPNLYRTRADSSRFKMTRKRRCSVASSTFSRSSVVDFEQKRQEIIRKSKSSNSSSSTFRPPSTDFEFCKKKYRSESSVTLTPPKPTFGSRDVSEDYVFESDVGSQESVSPAGLRLGKSTTLLPGLDAIHKPASTDDNRNSSNVSLPPSPEISIVEKIHLDNYNITKTSNFSTMNEQQISVVGRGSTIQISGIERLPFTACELDKSINGFEGLPIHNEARVAFIPAVELMEASESKCVESMEISEQEALKTVNTVTDSLLSKIENVNIGDAKSLSETIQKGLADIQLDSGVKGRRRGNKKVQVGDVVKTRSRSSTPNKRSKVAKAKKPNIDTVIEEEMHVDSFAKSMSEGAEATNAFLADIVPKKRRGRPKKCTSLSDLTNIQTSQVSETPKVTKPKSRVKKSVPSQSNDSLITNQETVKPKRARKQKKPLANTIENIKGNSKLDSNQVDSSTSKRAAKKPVIKVKVTKPKKSTFYSVQLNARHSDSGINDVDPSLNDLDESVDLIHNHSDTCLSFKACHANEDEESLVIVEQKVDLVNTTLDLTPPNCTMEETFSCTNNSASNDVLKQDDLRLHNDSGIAKPGDSLVCDKDASSPESRSSVLSLCPSPGLTRSLSACSDSVLTGYFTEDASTASRSASQTSQWHLLSEDEACDSPNRFDAAEWALMARHGPHLARHGPHLARLFPVICSVPELSTVTENSEQSKDDSRTRTLAPCELDDLETTTWSGH